MKRKLLGVLAAVVSLGASPPSATSSGGMLAVLRAVAETVVVDRRGDDRLSFVRNPYQCAKSYCRPRAAVVIEPVSVDSLRKTGIFAMWPETFDDFHRKLGEPGVQRHNRMREKPGFQAYSRVSWGA
jgi:hypothetical protein